MKTFVTTLCVALFATYGSSHHDKPIPDALEGEFEVCKDKMSLTDDQVESIVKFEDMESLGCLYGCMLKEAGAIKGTKFDQGSMHDLIKEIHKDDDEKFNQMLEVITGCIEEAVDEEDDCKMGIQLTTCVFENMKEDK